jgi:fructokinase
MLVESLANYMDLPSGPFIVAPELGAQAGPMGSIALAMDAAEAS